MLAKVSIVNKGKYAGDPEKVVARSSWEAAFMRRLDSNDFVVKWCSEPAALGIRYYNQVKRKNCLYVPDFLVQYGNGAVELIEIKPLKEVRITASSSAYDKAMVVQNMGKWKAASEWCSRRGIRFVILTERELSGSKK